MNTQLVRLGVFATLGIVILVGFSFYVNDEPYWYRSCNNIDITVDDATGLRRKSPVKTLGLDIGYIRSVDLDGTSVVINVCVTAPVKLRADTKAYVRSIGFLGDRFLELKPVDVRSQESGNSTPIKKVPGVVTPLTDPPVEQDSGSRTTVHKSLSYLYNFLIPSAEASDAMAAEAQAAGFMSTAQAADNGQKAPTKTLQASREAELTDTMKKVGKLVDQMTLLVKDVREATSQVEFKDLVVNLNGATKNLAEMLEPKSHFSTNLRKSMDSLHSSLQELEEAMKKVNSGQGTLGKLINDDKLYDEAVSAIKGLNMLLGKAGNLRVYIDLAGANIPAYDGTRVNFNLQIEPNPTRYYLLGVSTDPKGVDEKTVTTTTVNGQSTIQTQNINREKGINFTAALGKYFGPLDLRVGLIEGAGAAGANYWLDQERGYGIETLIYKQSKTEPIRIRLQARARIFMGLYVKGGVDDVKRYNNNIPYFVGAGLYFNDEDIKYLLAFK